MRGLWNGTFESFSKEEVEAEGFKDVKHHQENLKEALQILLDLLEGKTTVEQTVLSKILEDVVDSFNSAKASEEGVEKWLKNEYPRAMLESQLLRPLQDKKVELDNKHSEMLKEFLGHARIKEVFKDKEDLISI